MTARTDESPLREGSGDSEEVTRLRAALAQAEQERDKARREAAELRRQLRGDADGKPRPPYEAIGRTVWAYYRKYAAAQVAAAIKYGELARPETKPCHYCGGWARIYEHRNYHEPLSVVPACDSCNHTQPPAHLDPVTVLDHVVHRVTFPKARKDRAKA